MLTREERKRLERIEDELYDLIMTSDNIVELLYGRLGEAWEIIFDVLIENRETE